MKKRYLLIILLCIFSKTGIGQQLKPSIGLTNLPPNSSSICAIPVFTGNFNTSGYMPGDTIPHFKLYNKNGVATDVLTLLQTGKPLLLIGGNYTCPVFRQKISKINQLAATYGSQINILIVYGVEAHPKTPDTSPYSGTVWTTSENQQDNILYLQPTTYGARKQILDDMLADIRYPLSVPVLLDGPCNDWWLNFGTAPNNAYLIKPNGVIYKKHGWFDKNPNNIVTDINSLLAITGLKNELTADFDFYPNPANSSVSFDLSSFNASPVSLKITDVTGKIIFEAKNIKESLYKVETQSFKKGIYFIQVAGTNISSTRKLIIE